MLGLLLLLILRHRAGNVSLNNIGGCDQLMPFEKYWHCVPVSGRPISITLTLRHPNDFSKQPMRSD